MEKIAFHNLDFSLTSMDDKQYTFHWDSVFMIDDVKELPNECSSVKLCAKIGMNYASCSPFRVPIARLAAAQAAVEE
jgi:phosphoenolpyruvate synthase/pyruvate phosphate dikinase